MLMGILHYRLWKRSIFGGYPTVSYLIDTVWGMDKRPAVYQLNFSDAGENVLLTDYFPYAWRNDAACMRRSTSAEGLRVNVRELVRTCYVVFRDEIVPERDAAVMVVRGNHEPGEDPSGVSRKCRVYRHILLPLAERDGFEVVNGCDGNSFLILKSVSDCRKEEILAHYQSVIGRLR